MDRNKGGGHQNPDKGGSDRLMLSRRKGVETVDR